MYMEAALFDLDGTLLDSMGMWADIDERYLGRRGIAVPPGYQLAISAMRIADAATYSVRLFGLTDTPEQLMDEWLSMAREEYEQRIALKPHARQYLELLRARGVRLGTVSSLTRSLYEPVLRRNGVYELFDAFTSASEESRGKAYPDAYLLAADKLGIAPERCAMYDDLPEALLGARAAGMTTIGVYDPRAHAAREDMLRAADRFIMSFEDEIARIERQP